MGAVGAMCKLISVLLLLLCYQIFRRPSHANYTAQHAITDFVRRATLGFWRQQRTRGNESSFSDLSVRDSSEAAALAGAPQLLPSLRHSICSSTLSLTLSTTLLSSAPAALEACSTSSSLLAVDSAAVADTEVSTLSSSLPFNSAVVAAAEKSATTTTTSVAMSAHSATCRAPATVLTTEPSSMLAPHSAHPIASSSRSKSSKSPSPKQSPRDEGVGVAWPGELLSAYKNTGILGHGTFGSVYKACSIDDASCVVAIKVMPRALSDNECATEASLMQKLSHPHILKIHDILSDAEHMCLVLEYAPGGNMFDRIIESGASLYTELSCCALLRKVLTALAYMHSQGVCHRDLKPENILFRGLGGDAARVVTGEGTMGFHEPVITDFGLAVHVPDHRDLQPLQRTGCPPHPPQHDPSRDVTYLGTLGYCAPEMLDPTTRKVPHHGFAADVWSFGVLAYICLSGCHPLDLTGEDDDSLIANRTRMGDVIPMTGKYWENVSEQARTFISRCLRVNPAERPSFQDCLSDPWFESCSASDKEFAQLQENFERIVHLSARQLKHRRRWRSLVHWAIGIGMFATAKRKAREAAVREAPQALPPSMVHSSNTNKLARFAPCADLDRRSLDTISATSALATAGSRQSDEHSTTTFLSSSSRTYIAATSGAHGSVCSAASVSKRSSHDLHSLADESSVVETTCRATSSGGGATNAKRAAAFMTSAPSVGCLSDDSGSSSPVTDILTKRTSDDVDLKAAAGRALEKRTNDGGQSGQRVSRILD